MYADGMLSSEEYLEHFGIRGMKWGIRRYQNKDGTLTAEGRARIEQYRSERLTKQAAAEEAWLKKEALQNGYDGNVLKKGSTVYRIATDSDKIDDRRKYVTADRYDAEAYREAALEGAIARNAKGRDELRKFTYVTTADIKVASVKQQVDYIYEHFGDTKLKDLPPDPHDVYTKFVKKYGNTPIKSLRSDIEFARSTDIEGDKSDKTYRKLRDYQHSMLRMQDAFFKSTMFTKSETDVVSDKHYAMQEHFKKLGYQALIDLEDSDVAMCPMILLAPKDTLKQVSKKKI